MFKPFSMGHMQILTIGLWCCEIGFSALHVEAVHLLLTKQRPSVNRNIETKRQQEHWS